MSIQPFPQECAERFEPKRRIAVGGFGEVWLAEQRHLGRSVAIKLLHQGLITDATQIARFHDEALITAKLSHPNIVVLLDHGSAGGVPWIAYEYIGGPSLRDRLSQGRLGWRDAFQIGMQIADALDEAHRNGILHRDIKPDNVLESAPNLYRAQALVASLDLMSKLPTSGVAWLVVGGVIYREGLAGEARQMFAQALRLMPEKVLGTELDFAWCSLAWALLECRGHDLKAEWPHWLQIARVEPDIIWRGARRALQTSHRKLLEELLQQSAETQPTGDIAYFVLAGLRRDNGGDAAGMLKTLEEGSRRFPRSRVLSQTLAPYRLARNEVTDPRSILLNCYDDPAFVSYLVDGIPLPPRSDSLRTATTRLAGMFG